MTGKTPSSTSQDPLDDVEDEILALVKDAEKMTNALKDLPEKEEVARESITSIISRLAKIQDGLFDNIGLLADYVPYERSLSQAKLKARQAITDVKAANCSLWVTKSELDEKLPDDEADEWNATSNGPRSAGPSRPGPDSAKRMRHGH